MSYATGDDARVHPGRRRAISMRGVQAAPVDIRVPKHPMHGVGAQSSLRYCDRCGAKRSGCRCPR